MTEAAFIALYDRTARPLKAYLVRLVADSSLAEELVQEAYFRLWTAPSVDTIDEDALRGYLFRTATNLARDHFRRPSSRRTVSLDAPTDDGSPAREPVAPLADVDTQLAARQLLDQLEPRERKLLWLAYGEGRSHREIAASTGVKETSVRPLLYRLRQRLAAMWQPRENEGGPS